MKILSDILEDSHSVETVSDQLLVKTDSHLPLLKSATPLVSVIIPVYNSAKYIQVAIDSVLSQTYSNYEIIVIDDGSTDDTRQKLQLYKDKIRYTYQNNQGSAAARNVGINLAKGELIAFLDSDDYWLIPDKLTKQVAYFIDNPLLGCVNTGWKIVDGENKHIKTVQPWHKAPKLDLETWLKKKCVRTSAMIFRREWLEKAGGFDEELRQSHDVDLILRLSLAGCQSVWLKEETVCYRQHEENTTKNSLKQAKYVQAVLNKFFSRNDLPKSIREQESQIRYHTLVWLAWYQYRAGNLDEMENILQNSWDFSPYLKIESIAHWLNSFKRFSEERGEHFDVDFLTNSHQWKKLITNTITLTNITGESQSRELPKCDREEYVNAHSNSLEILEQEVTSICRQSSQLNKYVLELDNYSNQIVASALKKPNFQEDKQPQAEEQEKLDPITPLSLKNDQQLFQENFKLAENFHKNKQYIEAINHYRKALELQPNNWNVCYKLGHVLFKNKMWQESIVECRKSISLNPEFLWSYYNLARNLTKIKQYDEAVSVYLQALEIRFNCEVKKELILLLEERILYYYQSQQDDSEASNYYQKLIDIKHDLLVREVQFKSEEFKQYQGLGDTSSKNGKLNEAISYYQKAIEIQPNTWNVHQKLACVLFKQKKWHESISECHKVIKLKPDFLWSHYDLGRNLAQIGNWREAIDCYFNALDISYKPEIQQELELLLDKKITEYQSHLSLGLENLMIYQELLDMKGKIKIIQHKIKSNRSKQILQGFSDKISKKKKILCLMFQMKNLDFVESINFILHQMYEKKIYPIVFTDSVETELLFTNNVIFEYFPLSDKPSNFSPHQWQQYFQNRVANLVQEWSPQQVLNFNNTLSKELSHTLLSIG